MEKPLIVTPQILSGMLTEGVSMSFTPLKEGNTYMLEIEAHGTATRIVPAALFFREMNRYAARQRRTWKVKASMVRS